jgi:hypothetical protein
MAMAFIPAMLLGVRSRKLMWVFSGFVVEVEGCLDLHRFDVSLVGQHVQLTDTVHTHAAYARVHGVGLAWDVLESVDDVAQVSSGEILTTKFGVLAHYDRRPFAPLRDLFVDAEETLVWLSIRFGRPIGAGACARRERHPPFERVPQAMILSGDVVS